MISSLFQKRFDELQGQFSRLPSRYDEDVEISRIEHGAWQKWGTSAQNLLLAVFGETSPHYVNFLDAYKRCSGYQSDVNLLHGIFLSAKEDYEGGYIFNVDLKVSGEVFGDFVGMARQSLSEGHKHVAAVLACAALEDALKRFAATHDLNVADKSMQDVVNALKSKGLVSGAQKTLLDTMPRIRDFAMHANWEKISDPDVSSVIGFVEQFLLTKFSN